jgi:hypothetical protein
MIALVVPGLRGRAKELCTDPSDDLLLASGISRQDPFGAATRGLELKREFVQFGHFVQLATRHRPTP